MTFWPVGTAPEVYTPGDFLLVRNDGSWRSKNGFVSAMIRVGEYLRLRRARVPKATAKAMSRWNHGVCVGRGALVEAVGAGVVRSPLGRYTQADFLYVQTDLTDAQRADAAGFIDQMVGVRYGYWTIAAIGVRALTGLPLAFLARRTVICSGLVASMLGTWAWRAWPAWVMPSDLAAYHGITSTTLLDP